MSAFGVITLTRRHFRCPGCRDTRYTADELLGLEGYLSPRVLRLACRLVADRSFEVAADRLHECCGLSVSGETLRRHCTVAATAVTQWMRTDPGAAEPFQAASGEVEVQVDAGKVNTTTGWRDLKVLAFAKRPRGPAADPSAWSTRKLPEITARVVLADIEGIETFRRDWRAWADRLGVGSGAAVSVLGDGADWIWGAADAQFPDSRQVLDVYHALEYVSDAAKGLYGEGTVQTQASYERGRSKLLSDGWSGVCVWVADELSREDTAIRRQAVETLVSYLAKHVVRVGYKERLADGRSIGSGLIEGTIKTLGLRMKARGARWVERNAEHMAALVGLSNSTLWENYWTNAV